MENVDLSMVKISMKKIFIIYFVFSVFILRNVVNHLFNLEFVHCTNLFYSIQLYIYYRWYFVCKFSQFAQNQFVLETE